VVAEAQEKGEVGGFDGVRGRFRQKGKERLKGSFGWDH
jgi:hypothetical protein